MQLALRHVTISQFAVFLRKTSKRTAGAMSGDAESAIAGGDEDSETDVRGCQRIQPGGTLALRASSSMSAISFFASSISELTRCSSAIAFSLSSAIFAR